MERLAKLLFWGIIIAILYYLFPIFLPFLVALVFAIVFDPLIIDFQRKLKVKRHTSAIIILSIFFVGVFVIIYFSVSTMVKETIDFAKEVPSNVQSFINDNEKFNHFYNDLPDEVKDYISNSTGTITKKATELGSQLAGNILGIFKEFPSYFVAIIIFMVAVYIISIDLPRLKPQFLSFFNKEGSRDKVELALTKLKSSIVGFLKSQILLSFFTFVITLIGLLIIGANYAIVMSIVVVIVDLLPVLGTGSVLVPWAIYCFVFGSVGQGVGLIILFLFITVFRRIVEPKLIGASIGLSPLLTLISLYVGLELLGIVGMILGPILAIVIISLKDAGMIKFNLKV